MVMKNKHSMLLMLCVHITCLGMEIIKKNEKKKWPIVHHTGYVNNITFNTSHNFIFFSLEARENRNLVELYDIENDTIIAHPFNLYTNMVR